MSEREKQIQKTLEEAIPYLTEKQRGYILGYGEAVLDMHKEKNKTAQDMEAEQDQAAMAAV